MKTLLFIMGFSEEGLTRLQTIKNQTYYLNDLLNEIEKGNEDISYEIDYLKKANNLFDMILYGAGFFKKKYNHDNSISLNDYYGLFALAKDNGLFEDVKDMKGLRQKLLGYKIILRDIKKRKEIPQDNQEEYQSMKNFLIEYNKLLQ